MDLSSLMKNAQGMQSKMAAMQASLKERVIDASAGDGLVTAYVNGEYELLKIELDEKVVDPDDIEMLEDLILAAVNKANEEMRELTSSEMAKITGGMNIPGLM